LQVESNGQAREFSLDTETMGFYPWYKKRQIVSIGFTCKAGRADCLYLGPCPDHVPVIDPDLFAEIECLLTLPRSRPRGSPAPIHTIDPGYIPIALWSGVHPAIASAISCHNGRALVSVSTRVMCQRPRLAV
jgi:hypothetical protein